MTASVETQRVTSEPKTVTDGDTEICSAEFEGGAGANPTAPEAGEGLHSAITVGDRLRMWAAAARVYWTPPEFLTKRPPTVSAMAAYAKRGGWTRQIDGPIRKAGVAWYRYVGVPITARCRIREWIWQRPGRALTYLLLLKLLASTTPGAWAVDMGGHAVRALAWALL